MSPARRDPAQAQLNHPAKAAPRAPKDPVRAAKAARREAKAREDPRAAKAARREAKAREAPKDRKDQAKAPRARVKEDPKADLASTAVDLLSRTRVLVANIKRLTASTSASSTVKEQV